MLKEGEAALDPLAVCGILVPQRFHGLKFDVEQGILEIPNNGRFYFGFASQAPERRDGISLPYRRGPDLELLPIFKTDLGSISSS